MVSYEMNIKEEHFVVETVEKRNKRKVKIGKFYCILNGKTYPTLGGLRNAIKSQMTMQSYYDKYYLSESESKICKCGKKLRFKNVLEGYGTLCGDCVFEQSQTYRRHRVRDRFKGQDGEKKKQIAVNKTKETNDNKTDLEKSLIQEKRISTLLKNKGEDWFSVKAKAQWERRSEEEVASLVNKANATKIKNGTMEYNFYANANRKVVIEGKEWFCQGYEDMILNLLSKLNIVFVNGKEVPRITTKINKSGIYRPDIFIPSKNLIIEVKSTFTLLNGFENNVKKQIDSLNQGYFHIFFVIERHIKDRIMLESDKICFSDFLSMSISSQAHYFEKVQRLSRDGEYRAIAIGSGSAKVPLWDMI